MDVKGKVAVITGASKGIGRATALLLASHGAKIAISARSGILLSEVAGRIQNMGREVFTFSGDMSDEAKIKSFVSGTVDALGGIDILVNNAGFGFFHTVLDFPTQNWDDMFNLNMRGLFLTTREALPHLRLAGESVIVNVASLAGKNAFINGAGYAATKHAVVGFSRCLMLEERKNGVRVLLICPGSVDTNFFDDRIEKKERGPDQILQPEDVAASILHMIRQPQRSMVSEIDIRPSNP